MLSSARIARASPLVLTAVMLGAAGAQAAPPRHDLEAAALKEIVRTDARASGEAPLLPLGAPVLARRADASRVARDVRALAARNDPVRVLIALRRRDDIAAVAREARSLGGEVRAYEGTGVIAVTAASPRTLVRRLRDDPRVASLEPDRRRVLLADSADAIDPETGIPFGWAFDEIRAGPAIELVGGGSRRLVAVIDSGLDVTHPELRDSIAGTFNTADGGTDVTDGVGHGTFVAGLISMRNDNDLGGSGAAGATRIFAVRADDGAGQFSTESLLAAKEVAIGRGADILNMSLGGDTLSEAEARALDLAFLSDVLPVAAAGNEAERGNPVAFPAAALGGFRGAVGIGLSVGATKPDGTPAAFSTHNDFVSVAAPGAAANGCAKGVFSTVPANTNLIFDDPDGCSDVYSEQGVRFGYSEGTSFAAPLVSAIAALAWQAERRLASEQVADVVQRSARQTFGSRWNEFTGHGVVDAQAAVGEARRYDVVSPRFRARTRRVGGSVEIAINGGRDRADRGERPAGGIRYALALRTSDGGIRFVVDFRRQAIRRVVAVRGRTTYIAIACDANGNCATRRLTLRRA